MLSLVPPSRLSVSVTAENIVSPIICALNTVATMFEEASEVFDNMFKSSFPLTFIVFLPAVLILVSPLPAEAAHEFTVYRMQQYDLQGQPYGKTAAPHIGIHVCFTSL